MATREYSLEHTRNIGIIAHIDAGKTTTTERILFYTKKIHKIGEVHEGARRWTGCPRNRNAASPSLGRDHLFLEGPSYQHHRHARAVDFTVEVERSLRVLDGGVVVFDAVAGVEPQSETVWRQADKYHVPRICFVNKMDRAGGEFLADRGNDPRSPECRAAAIRIPIGRESDFRGFVDLIEQQGDIFPDDLGTKSEIVGIPADISTMCAAPRTSDRAGRRDG